MDFLIYNNTYIFLLLALGAIIMLIAPTAKRGNGSGAGLTPKQAVALTKDQGAIFIDVRSEEAFKAGSIAQARHYPLETLENQAHALPHNKPLILVCDYDRTAYKAASILKRQKLEQAIYVLNGGLKAWSEEGLPLRKHGTTKTNNQPKKKSKSHQATSQKSDSKISKPQESSNQESVMPAITVFFKPTCPYCAKAFDLLDKKGVKTIEKIDIAAQPERKPEMVERANGRTTVPQIFIGNTHVGGCDDLFALDNQGKLDALLTNS